MVGGKNKKSNLKSKEYWLKNFRKNIIILLICAATIDLLIEQYNLLDYITNEDGLLYYLHHQMLMHTSSVIGAMATILAITFAFVSIFVMMMREITFGIRFEFVIKIEYSLILDDILKAIFALPIILFLITLISCLFEWPALMLATILSSCILIYIIGRLTLKYAHYSKKENVEILLTDSIKNEDYSIIQNVITSTIVNHDEYHFDLLLHKIPEIRFYGHEQVYHTIMNSLLKLLENVSYQANHSRFLEKLIIAVLEHSETASYTLCFYLLEPVLYYHSCEDKEIHNTICKGIKIFYQQKAEKEFEKLLYVIISYLYIGTLTKWERRGETMQTIYGMFSTNISAPIFKNLMKKEDCDEIFQFTKEYMKKIYNISIANKAHQENVYNAYQHLVTEHKGFDYLFRSLSYIAEATLKEEGYEYG